jgi:GTP 3',8-cyclase
MLPTDALGRPIGTLRVSVTDRCNIRCAYCMPEAHYDWLPRADVLTFEEVARVASVFRRLGVARVRFTGGEPLLRRGLPTLVGEVAQLGFDDLALTTNGILLAPQADRLREAGLRRITVSLDTLDRERFKALTRTDALGSVLEGIAAARRVFGALKLDTVLMRGVNDEELVPLVEFARDHDAEIRFIEYMDVPGASQWRADALVTRAEMLAHLTAHYGAVTPIAEGGSAPADRFRLPDGLVLGIIASTTTPFCRTCDRVRLTADGTLFTCLYATSGLDLRTPLRAGASDEDLSALITGQWRQRTDRGAEERLLLAARAAFDAAGDKTPHLQMHTRGG